MPRMIPIHKQRVAGKSLPIEKFAVAKSERYIGQRGNLPLAALVRSSGQGFVGVGDLISSRVSRLVRCPDL